MGIKILLLLLFFGSMIAIGLYSRKHASSVAGFVLGGRNVGPWLTAFAYGTSYFSAVVFVGYAGQFGWKYGLASAWIGLGNAFIGSLLAWVVRSEVWVELGGLDDRFFAHMEEIDLCWRMQLSGWRVCVVPQSVCGIGF